MRTHRAPFRAGGRRALSLRPRPVRWCRPMMVHSPERQLQEDSRRGRFAAFRALRNRNFRRFAISNAVSIVGTVAQTVAQAWLVVEVLGRSGAALGLVLALTYLPLLVAAPVGGLFADRHDRRRVLLATQTGLAACAATLAALTLTGVVEYWMVCAVAACVGIVTVIDTPARHSFIAELVGPAEVANAISVNSMILHLSRIIGPLIAAVLIARVSVGACFALNAFSFLAVLLGLAGLRSSEMHLAAHAGRSPGQITAAFHYVRTTPVLRTPLLLLAVIGTLTMNYTVILPLLARDEFSGSSSLGIMTASMSAGSMAGALYGAWRSRPTQGLLLISAAVLGAAFCAVALTPSVGMAAPLLIVAGAGHIVYLNTTNSILQSQADPEMRGRVMAFYSQLFLGSTPVGAPIIGYLADHFGPRTAVVFAGGVAVAVAVVATLAGVRRGPLMSGPGDRQTVTSV